MTAQDPEFMARVHDIVAAIPGGRVMSYGQIGSLCGRPRSARLVGRIAQRGAGRDLPWHRVVHADGSLASGYGGGVASQRLELEAEGVRFHHDGRLPIDELRWEPDGTQSGQPRPVTEGR